MLFVPWRSWAREYWLVRWCTLCQLSACPRVPCETSSRSLCSACCRRQQLLGKHKVYHGKLLVVTCRFQFGTWSRGSVGDNSQGSLFLGSSPDAPSRKCKEGYIIRPRVAALSDWLPEAVPRLQLHLHHVAADAVAAAAATATAWAQDNL